MVSPARRRDAVTYLKRRHPISERRACSLIGQHRSTQRYRAQSPEFEQALLKRMNELAAKHPRYGSRPIWALLRGEGFQVNRKRIERLWRLEGHRVPPQRKSRQKKALGGKQNASWNLAASHQDQIWSYDFLSERTVDGRQLRVLNVVDEYTRICVGSKVARNFGAGDVQVELERLFDAQGRPKILRSDNGREFAAESLADWLRGLGVAQAFIDRGAPQQNPYVERFNGTMRNEVLNGELFHSVLEAQVVIDQFVEEYNTIRPHRGLGMKSPRAFAASTRVGRE